MFSRDYPYMYARVSAKRAKLLDSRDYQNLSKMQPNGIARNLGERDYKEDIDRLGSEHQGVELVELALMRNLSRTMRDLVDISPESLEPVIKGYLRRYDIISIKRLLRWKKGGEQGNIHSFLVPVGDYDLETLEELSEKSFEEIVESIEFPDSETDYQEKIGDETDLRKIERDLDRAYYKDLEGIKGSVSSIWFDKFIDREIEYENLKIALRLKKHGLEAEEIREWLVSLNTTDLVEKVISAENIEEAMREVTKEIDQFDVENGETIEEVEHGIEIDRLNRAMRTVHVEPLSATSILGYVVAKIIEVRNLRMLIRAKETGIQNEETVKRKLVVA